MSLLDSDTFLPSLVTLATFRRAGLSARHLERVVPGCPSCLQKPLSEIVGIVCQSLSIRRPPSFHVREAVSWFSMLIDSPAHLPLPWRPWRTLREPFFRSPSAMARQDAAPPEVARDLLNKQRTASGGAASSRAAGCEITENIGLFACFRFPDASRAGRPCPDGTSIFLPLFHVREAVFMVFNAD